MQSIYLTKPQLASQIPCKPYMMISSTVFDLSLILRKHILVHSSFLKKCKGQMNSSRIQRVNSTIYSQKLKTCLFSKVSLSC